MIAHEGVSEGRNAAIVSAPSSLPPRVFSTSPTRAGLLCARMVPSGMVTAIKRTSGRSANSSTRYCNRMPVRERVPDRTPLSSAVTSATTTVHEKLAALRVSLDALLQQISAAK